MKGVIKTISHLSFLIFLFILTSSCNNSPTEPVLQPGRRDYVWTVDTLSYQGSSQTLMKDIWGSNPQNIWVVGHNERSSGKIYHFDGKSWTPSEMPTLPSPTLNSIIGFNERNIFVVGSADYLINKNNSFSIEDSSLIIHFDGSSWRTSILNGGRALFSIAGTANNTYTAGYNKTFFQFDGMNWIHKTLTFSTPPGYDINYVSSILKRSNASWVMLYQCSNSKGNEGFHYFLIKNDEDWIKVDSFSTSTSIYKWGSKLWESPQGVLYSANPGFYRFINNSWENISNDNNLYTALSGTDANNIFLAGEKIIHFNGNDFFEFSDFSYKYGLARSVLCFSKEVFLVFSNGNKSFIIRGNLKN